MPLPPARDGHFATSLDVVEASAAHTASGATVFTSGGSVTSIVIELRVTAVSGTTPQLNVSLDDTFDGTNWNQVAAVNAAAITAAGTTVKRINLRDTPVTDQLRISWTISGTTPSFTFGVKVYLDRD